MGSRLRSRHRPGLRPWLSILVFALVASAGLARPTVRVSDVRLLDPRRPQKLFLARVDGRDWVFKLLPEPFAYPDGSGRVMYPNYEGEILSARMLRRVGFLSPALRTVNVEGRTGVYLQMELIDSAFGASEGRLLAPWETGRGWRARLDMVQIRTLQLLDVIMGNQDRNEGNLRLARQGDRLLLPRAGRETLVPIPFDGDWALVTGELNELAVVRGLRESLGPPVPPDRLLREVGPAGMPESMMNENRAYNRALQLALRDPEALVDYVRIAEHLRGVLDDAWLERIVSELPDEDIGTRERSRRRADILRLVKARRDALARWFAETVLLSPRARAAGDRMARAVPGGLAGLRLGARERLYLVENLLAPARLDPGAAYFHLRAAGLEAARATEVVTALASREGVALEAGVLGAAEARVEAGEARGAVDTWLRAPTTEAAGVRGPAPFPLGVTAAEATVTGAGAEGRNPWGGELAPGQTRELERVVEELRGRFELRAGETLVVLADPFAGGPGERVLRVEVRGEDGVHRISETVTVRDGRLEAPPVTTPRGLFMRFLAEVGDALRAMVGMPPRVPGTVRAGLRPREGAVPAPGQGEGAGFLGQESEAPGPRVGTESGGAPGSGEPRVARLVAEIEALRSHAADPALASWLDRRAAELRAETASGGTQYDPARLSTLEAALAEVRAGRVPGPGGSGMPAGTTGGRGRSGEVRSVEVRPGEGTPRPRIRILP